MQGLDLGDDQQTVTGLIRYKGGGGFLDVSTRRNKTVPWSVGTFSSCFFLRRMQSNSAETLGVFITILLL